jgi:hypothetical protein
MYMLGAVTNDKSILVTNAIDRVAPIFPCPTI